MTALVGSGVGGAETASVVAMLDDASYAAGSACAIARAFPLYTAKSKKQKLVDTPPSPPPTVKVGFATAEGATTSAPLYTSCAAACEGVRRAAMLVDMPPEHLTTTAFVGEAQEVAARLNAKGKGVEVSVISASYTVVDVEGKHPGSSMSPYENGKLEQTVGGFDLIYHGGPMKNDKQTTYTSKLGCFDGKARLRSLKKLHAKHKAAAGEGKAAARPLSDQTQLAFA